VAQAGRNLPLSPRTLPRRRSADIHEAEGLAASRGWQASPVSEIHRLARLANQNGKEAQAGLDIGSGLLSLAGAGAAAKVFTAERGLQAAEEGVQAASGRLGTMIDAAETHFSGPISSRMAAYSAMEHLSGYSGALETAQAASMDLGGAQAEYDLVSSAGLVYTMAFDNPY